MTTPVSIGICAYNEAERICALLESLLDQAVPEPLEITEILVVASGCSDGTEALVRDCASRDPRIRLISQPRRLGKASALNEILRLYSGQLLVLVNADARLAPDSLANLTRLFLEPAGAEVACGAPVLVTLGSRLPRYVEEIQWSIHNRSLEVLSQLGRGNHCCDELMAVRRGFVESLPSDLINDGAYLGVIAALRGHTVRFCAGAKVYVHGPRNLRGVLRQRRRVLLGHRQVRELLNRSPNTLEELVKRNPKLAVSILLSALREEPSYLGFFAFVLVPLELVSLVLATLDRAWTPLYSSVWAKVDDP